MLIALRTNAWNCHLTIFWKNAAHKQRQYSFIVARFGDIPKVQVAYEFWSEVFLRNIIIALSRMYKERD